MARRYSSSAVAMGHNALTRVIRHAEARDLVGRNVAVLVDTPKGQAGRPSKSLSLEQASALLAAAEGTRMHAYIALCLATGIRTEEARALRWEHVDFGDPDARPPVSASAAVWRSVRAHGDTKTEKSRRTLGLPKMAVDALRAHKKRQARERLAVGGGWSDEDLVFSTRTGGALDAANVRREFRAVCKAAKIGEHWTPRELCHSFVSLMSSSGVPVEEIARIAGHSSSRTTEVVYRRELRPILCHLRRRAQQARGLSRCPTDRRRHFLTSPACANNTQGGKPAPGPWNRRQPPGRYPGCRHARRHSETPRQAHTGIPGSIQLKERLTPKSDGVELRPPARRCPGGSVSSIVPPATRSDGG